MKYLLFVATMLYGILAHSQQTDPSSRFQSTPDLKSHIDRYKEDYELKDYSFENGDSTILNHLDLDNLEPLRPSSGVIEVIDPNTGLEIILYSRKHQLSIVEPEKSHKL